MKNKETIYYENLVLNLLNTLVYSGCIKFWDGVYEEAVRKGWRSSKDHSTF